MESEFIAAILVATVTFVLVLLMGPQITEFLGMMGKAVLVLPIALVLLATMIVMINADPAATSNIAETTTSWTISYVVGKLPGIIISEIAGAIVGAVGGFVVRLVSSF